MTRDDILLKLDELVKRLIRYRDSNYSLIIMKEEDRLDFKKNLEYVEHAIKLIKSKYISDFAKVDMIKLNNVWKRYKPKEYISHA